LKISIFGLGYVGVVSGACLADAGHEVIGVDISNAKIAMLNDGACPIVEPGLAALVAKNVGRGRLRATTDVIEAVQETDISFVSVGTPSAANGALSTEQVQRVSREIGSAIKVKPGSHAVVYRSTMLPGTMDEVVVPLLTDATGRAAGDGLEVCYNPEFLREGSSLKDFRKPPMTVLGTETETMRAMMADINSDISGQTFHTSFKIAESIKYMSNLFHAVKIAYANEMGTLLKDSGVDAREAARIFCKDRVLNVGPAYLRPGFAFGGSCLPKDLRAVLSLARQRDIDLPLLTALEKSNDLHIERAFEMVAAAGSRDVAFFGLSFKPGTDDLRESPLVTLAERLIGKGYRLRIHDPWVQAAALIGTNKEFIGREIPHIEELMCDHPHTALDGAGVVVIGHADGKALNAIKPVASLLPIIDLQGLPEIQTSAGSNYRGICW
jgi:GDP-mannose 6-dehydrogenase